MNSDNNIRNQFKSKFDDFKVPVPDDEWDQIEKSLNSIGVIQNHNVRKIWRIVGAVAAVAVLIFGSLLFLNLWFSKEEFGFSYWYFFLWRLLQFHQKLLI